MNKGDQGCKERVAEATETVGVGQPSPARLHHALTHLRSMDDLAEKFGLSQQRIEARAKHCAARLGVGMKLGNSWVWSAEEIEVMRPDEKHQ